MKDIRIERFLCKLLLSRFESEIQCDGLLVDGTETDVTHVDGIAPFNKEQYLYYAVHCNLLSTELFRSHIYIAFG